MILADAITANVLNPSVAFGTLLLALGLSSTAGLRAYLPLLAVAIAGSQNIVPLNSNFTDLTSPAILIILGLLVVGEFTVDKIPVVDHVSDLVHTVIRPISGAIIMAGTQNTLSTHSSLAAAGVGALLAFAVHGVKATTRPAVTATTAGLGNTLVSIVEDVIAIAAVLLMLLAPIVGLVLLVVLALMLWRLVRGIVRRIRGKGGAAGRPARKRGRAAQAVAPVVVPAAPAPVPSAPAPVPPATFASPAGAGTATYTPAMPATPGAPVPATPTATTIAATQQAPYPPASPGVPRPNPLLTPTQPYPGGGVAPYPDDATTLPGSY